VLEGVTSLERGKDAREVHETLTDQGTLRAMDVLLDSQATAQRIK
jgi:hypothetical protein